MLLGVRTAWRTLSLNLGPTSEFENKLAADMPGNGVAELPELGAVLPESHWRTIDVILEIAGIEVIG